jgi:hypothetical protein
MSKFASNSVAGKLAVFAAVVGVTGALAGSVALAKSNNSVAASVTGYSKEQCKDNGWVELGFENQGQCVSYFATGGSTTVDSKTE